jgi:hypothetical protein
MKRSLLVALLAIGVIACGAGGDQPIDSSDPTPPTTSGGTIPDDAGPVFVDGTDILLMESFPVQVALSVTGNLPTPCHEPVWRVEDDGTTISVTLASVTDPSVMCTQVLEPFQISIPLGAFESGSRTVTLNGTEVGEFDI